MVQARAIAMCLFSVTLGLSLLGAPQLASARVLKWELRDVRFDDGDPVIGYLLFDADAAPDKKLVGWDVGITANGLLPAYRFTSSVEPEHGSWQVNPYGSGCNTAAGCFFFSSKRLLDLDPVGRTILGVVLIPRSGLSDAGGKVAVGGHEGSSYGLYPPRAISSGQLVAIPEPAEGWVFALGLVAIIGLSTRRELSSRSGSFV
jgi:hypothetical protein